MSSSNAHLETASTADTTKELPYSLPLELTVQDADCIEELWKFREGEERDRFALRALRVGLLALKQAQGTVDTEHIRSEADRLLDTMQGRLNEHSRGIDEKINATLKDYFDPQDGRFQERINRLINRDGELETLLKQQLGTEDSELCKTLVAHFGDESQLMKMLDPNQSQGVIAAFKETLDDQLRSQREHVLNQFSLDNQEGALCRFITELTKQQGELTDNLHEKVDMVVKEFSLNEDDSALSRFKKLLEQTNSTINNHLSLDDDDSALARLKREMFQLLADQRETNQKFQEEVKTALQVMVARKQEAERSTRHGLEFEEAVYEKIQFEAQKTNDIATSTGNKTGLIKNNKVGDCVIELGPESSAPGSCIVIEAKEKGSYQLADAREEIEVARKNRGAQIGLFIFSKRTAPQGIDPFLRYGDDIFITWDAEDAGTDIYLNVAVTLARALCIREQSRRESVAVDFSQIDQAILEIEKRAGALDDIETWTKTIRNNADKIMKKVNSTRNSLLKQVETLNERTDDLKQAFTNDES